MANASRWALGLVVLGAVLSAGCVRREPLHIDVNGAEFRWDDAGMAGATVTFAANAAPDNWNSMRYVEWFEVTLEDGQRWRSEDWDKEHVKFERMQAPGTEGMEPFSLQAETDFFHRSGRDFAGIVPNGTEQAYTLEWKLGIAPGFNADADAPWTMASFNGSIEPGRLKLDLGDPRFECSDGQCRLRSIGIHVESAGPTPVYVGQVRLFLDNASTPLLSRVPVIEFADCDGGHVQPLTTPEYYRLFYGDGAAVFGPSTTTLWPGCLGDVEPGLHQLRLLAWLPDGSLVSSSERPVVAANP